MKSLLLDLAIWDLCLDANGNIAVAEDPYATAQDVACACRTFIGEVWYDTTLGIPYTEQILGKFSWALPILKKYLADSAKRVPGVVNPVAFISGYENRQISGQIQFKLET